METQPEYRAGKIVEGSNQNVSIGVKRRAYKEHRPISFNPELNYPISDYIFYVSFFYYIF